MNTITLFRGLLKEARPKQWAKNVLVFAAPGAARYLADFGADVIKVEPPTGDGVRRMGWLPPDGSDSYIWKLLGRNKRSVVMDLKADAGREAFLRLCDGADVLVENSRPGTFERLGVGPEVLCARNPRLVMLRVTGFGQDGPYAARPGFATMAEGMSGFAAINGDDEQLRLAAAVGGEADVSAVRREAQDVDAVDERRVGGGHAGGDQDQATGARREEAQRRGEERAGPRD